MPVARSWPDRRPGSPWQRCAGFAPLALTWWAVLARPRTVWNEVSVRPRPAASLLPLTLAVAALLPAVATAVPTGRFRNSLAYSAVFFVVAWLLMLALTSIEFTGVRFFGRQRGWRITPPIALIICAHASVGWLAGSAGMALAWLVGTRISAVRDTALYALVFAPFIAGMCLFSLLAGAGFHALRFANDAAALERRSDAGVQAVKRGPRPPAPASSA